MAEIRITAQERDPRRRTNRALRRDGIVPGVYYNRKGEVRCLQFDRHALDSLLRKEIGVLRVDVGGELLDCIVREVQRHPVRRDILHIDLMGIVKGQKIRAHVPLYTTGTAPGIKEGGVLELVIRELEVECEPAHLPTRVEVDVSQLQMNEGIRLGDLRIEGVVLMGDPQMTLVHVVPPRQVEEVAAAPAAEVAEPEVIRERKAEGEEEEEKEKGKEKEKEKGK
jgi:large subunit ribosomal protein L25